MNLPVPTQAPRRPSRDLVTIDVLDIETKRPRLILKITGLSLALFLTWAWLAEIDQVTRAPGTVIASSRSQVIQAVDGGTLQELLVREGDTVEANQLLARLDKAKLEASYLEARGKAAALRMNVQRLQAELFDQPIAFGADAKLYPQFRENQLALMRKRKEALNQELSSLERMLSLAKQELDMTEPLLKTGDVSKSDVLRLQRQVADLNA